MSDSRPIVMAYDDHEVCERELLTVIAERDEYHETADRLAAAIAALTRVEIGEHSSMNDPWANALDAAERELGPRFAANPYTGPCPVCGVPAGRHCVNREGREIQPAHESRARRDRVVAVGRLSTSDGAS